MSEKELPDDVDDLQQAMRDIVALKREVAEAKAETAALEARVVKMAVYLGCLHELNRQ